MLYTELVFRIISLLTSVLMGILTYAGAAAFTHLGLYVIVIYGLFLLFKKYLFAPGLNHVVRYLLEVFELALILILHKQTGHPFAFLLYVSYIVRVALVYPLRPAVGLFLLSMIGWSVMAVYAYAWKITGEDFSVYAYHLALLACAGYLGRTVQAQFRQGRHRSRDMSNILAVKEKLITQLDESREMIREHNKQLSDIVRTDELTGLFTHRYLMEYLEYLFQYIHDTGDIASLLMVSIDHFRRVNEKYGYQSGDEVLQSIALLIQDNAGEDDVAVRYGGDEFVLVLPGQGKDQARMIAEGIRSDFATAKIEDSRLTEMDISIGVASTEYGADNREDILDQANRDMYIVKRTKTSTT